MEAAGLLLGVLGVAGLFSACIDNFDLVVRAKDFSEDFDTLCTLVGPNQFILRRPASY
jgi:hypothetical protein